MPTQREKRIPPRISEGGSHALRRGDISDLAHGPFQGDPFAGRMRKNGREAKESHFFIDSRALDSSVLMPARLFPTMSNPLDSGA